MFCLYLDILYKIIPNKALLRSFQHRQGYGGLKMELRRTSSEGWCALSDYFRTFSFEGVQSREIKNVLATYV